MKHDQWTPEYSGLTKGEFEFDDLPRQAVAQQR